MKIFLKTPINNIISITFFKNKVDVNLLDKAINIVIKNNDGIRIRLCKNDDNVKQYVSEYQYTKHDLYNFEDKYEEYSNWINSTNSKLFELHDSNLYYIAIIINPNCKIGIYQKFHHIISDGWSIVETTNKIVEAYSLIQNNNEYEFNKSSYVDYIIKEKNYKKSLRYKKDSEFWINKFKDVSEGVNLKLQW